MFSSNRSQSEKALENVLARCNAFADGELSDEVKAVQQEIIQKVNELRLFIGKSRTGTLGNNPRPQKKLSAVNQLINNKYGLKLTAGGGANPTETDKKFQSIAKIANDFRRRVNNDGDVIIEEILDLCFKAIQLVQG